MQILDLHAILEHLGVADVSETHSWSRRVPLNRKGACGISE